MRTSVPLNVYVYVYVCGRAVYRDGKRGRKVRGAGEESAGGRWLHGAVAEEFCSGAVGRLAYETGPRWSDVYLSLCLSL